VASRAQLEPDFADAREQVGTGKKIIKDRFVLEDLLGTGGMGRVYRAKDLRKVEARDRDPWVALKLLNEDFKKHPGAFISLQREARKAQQLAHPNVVQVYDFDRDGETVFMTLELLRGSDLSRLIRDNPSGLPQERVRELVPGIGAALEHAHQHNITHADFKPANVFVTEDGVAKVLDFGIARAVSSGAMEADPGQETVFDPGSLGGMTPDYASLEMMLGMVPSPSDDIFAFGCVIYQMLTGRHPFDNKTALKVAEEGGKPEKIAGLPRRQWASLQKCLALKRANRYQTVGEFLGDFAPQNSSTTRLAGLATGALTVALAIFALNHFTPETAPPPAPVIDQRLLDRNLQWAKDALGGENFDKAEEHLSEIEARDPAYPGLAEWRDKLSAARQAYQQRQQAQMEVEQQVEALMAGARDDIEADRLTLPLDANAYLKFRAALEIQANNGEAREGLAMIEGRMEDMIEASLRETDLSTAESRIERLYELYPENAHAGSYRFELQRLQREQREFSERVAGLLQSAEQLRMAENYQAARNAYQQLINLDQGNRRAIDGLRQVNRDALILATAALAAEPVDPGALLTAQGAIDAARLSTPELPEIKMTEAAIEASLERQRARLASNRQKAQAHTNYALDLVDDPDASPKDYKQARQALLEARRISPDFAEAGNIIDKLPQAYLGRIEQEMTKENYVLAEEFIRDALLVSPGDTVLLELLEENEELLEDAVDTTVITSF
jgi:tetratricopeptide (TPR) repeat protein